jgi:hypothetical protein
VRPKTLATNNGGARIQLRLTRWVHVSGLRPPTAAGRERGGLGKAADTPLPGFARLRGVVNREYVRCHHTPAEAIGMNPSGSPSNRSAIVASWSVA